MECHQVGHSTRWKELNKVLECSACHNQCCNQKENDKGRNHEFPPVPDRIILVLTRPHSTIIDIGLILTCFGLFGISWYATRQRIREISIRKIHGATSRQIVLLLNKPFCLQILLAYILAVPIVYWLMHHWHEQFAYKAPFTVMDFLLPLCIVWIISAVTVCLQSYLLNKTNPIDCIKSE
jgi:hypothetical protein